MHGSQLLASGERRAPVRDGALGGEVDAHAHARPAEGEQAVRAAQLAAGRQAQHRARPPRVQQAVLRARGAGASGGMPPFACQQPHAEFSLMLDVLLDSRPRIRLPKI